jgi:plasmid stabilization system protein ParE
MDLLYKISISEAALTEFDEAYLYYKSIEDELGVKFANSINSEYVRLCQNPYLFKEVGKAVRQCIVETFPYVVHYKVIETEQEILIISVFHTARNPKIWKNRL